MKKKYSESAHQKLVPDFFLILVNSLKQEAMNAYKKLFKIF